MPVTSQAPSERRAQSAVDQAASARAFGDHDGPAEPAAGALVMGILNTTPDSFSDGGAFLAADDAIAHGRAMIAEGASIIDVGGESTRPGARAVSTAEELARVVTVVEALSETTMVSIDTRSEAVARAAVDVGASIINDVGAGLGHVAADLGVGWIAMHSPAPPAVMAEHCGYDDVVADVTEALIEAAIEASRLGVPKVWIDPGIGFGKDLGGNLDLLAHLDHLVVTGWPVALGTSRKSSLGVLSGRADRRASTPGFPPAADPPADDRLEASLATAVWAAAAGVDLLRVHDVAATVAALAAAGVPARSTRPQFSTTGGAPASTLIPKER